MAHKNHDIARAYFDAVSKGELPDSLLTSDMTAWTTLGGDTDKASYQGMVKMLGAMCKRPPVFTIKSITAEDDRVVVEADSETTLINGADYRNTYVFIFRIRDGRIASVAEHFNALIMKEKLTPLMKTLAASRAN